MEINFPKLEEKILKFWKENKIFEKSISQRKKRPNFVFYEGPPTANALPGFHHILARAFKDIIPRYKTMRGFRVLRKGGWDTHGLPVELQIEKKLGLKNKKDIEKYGIAKFNKKCKESVWNYKKDWEKLTERIGFWLDMENPYITYQTDYIESIWWILKEIHKKGLLYQGFKVVPYCPRCGTSLSSHEVAQGYKKITELAIYVKLRIKNPEFKDSYLLIWTTTPWTLPGNVAIAVNPNFTYVKVKTEKENLIIAKDRMEACGVKGEIQSEFKGKKLIGLRYRGLYSSTEEISKNAYKVVPADFISLKEGTGLVHIAPAFGEEDMEVGKKNDLPILLNVDERGRFRLTVKKWARIFVKEADPLIIEDLTQRNILFKKELYEHDYPFCWRCKTHLLYYAKKSWFIRMKKLKKDLIQNNEKINWVPAHLKKGRFGEWIKGVKDWAISRERYWGTPLPIWKCKGCENLEVIGSKRDLLAQKFSKNNYFILRHGESLRNLKKMKGIAVCWPEKIHCPLTKKGEEKIKKVAKKLKAKKIDLIFSSDLLRTKQTAGIVGEELGLKPKLDKRLREINVGILNGKSMEEVGRFWDKEGNLNPLEYYSRRFQVAPPKGETYIKVEKRMSEFIKEVDKEHQGKNILIVSHSRPITLLEKVVQGYDLKKLVQIITGKKEVKTGEVRKLEFKNLPYNEERELDFHRPYIDKIKFGCQKCGKIMEKVPEVIDVWFDSGSMPFAQYHYPFENKELIDKESQFPADYISEGIDQTRGWFYTLLAISTLLKKGSAYKNVISLGHVLDEKGEKMSKSKGNTVDPWYIFEKYGADATRWYFFTVNQPGDSKLFSEKGVQDSLKKFIMLFWNCFIFFTTYTKPTSQKSPKSLKSKNILDKWVISKLNELILETTKSLDKYDIVAASRLIEDFIINTLSLWYIRRSRKRFQKPETEKELKEASYVLGSVLLILSKLTAPFVPFLSEEIYQKLEGFDFKSSKSVHFLDWPKANKKLIVKSLNEKMERVRKISALALSERAKAKIKVRQPLQKLKIKDGKLKTDKELLDLIKEELNVKEIAFDAKIKSEVELDIEITPKLKEEGLIREVIRYIQQMRKKAGLKPKHKISVSYSGSADLKKILTENKSLILKETKAEDLKLGKKGRFKMEKEIEIDGQKLWLSIKKN